VPLMRVTIVELPDVKAIRRGLHMSNSASRRPIGHRLYPIRTCTTVLGSSDAGLQELMAGLHPNAPTPRDDVAPG